ncbi:alpha/beta fold hydrolase [uncultured Alistipes sp.]|uniref:alpha/beta hydrolase n=1 Tax=uncultured Alistipes sp. TaxID=538949 RepID=UPI0026039269|nr:alpha/beta fold hydrolase [uncultured Alistipes sp.]
MKTIQWLGTLLLLATLLTAQAKEEEVAIPQPWGTLRGTLVTPDEPANTAVLIIAGSGPIDRNGNGGPALHTNAYYQLAEALKSTGIASLRYDKQGIGASTYTDPNQRIPEDSLRFEDYINGARACIDYLRQTGFEKVVLAGHSEGSLIALALAADGEKGIAAVISIAGAGFPIDEILQIQLGTQTMGVNPGLMLSTQKILSRLKQGESVPESEIPPQLQMVFRPSIQPYMSSWMQYDPREEIRNVQQPVLILNGDNDLQVSVKDAEALAQAQPKARKIIIHDMTHPMKISQERDMQQQVLSVYTNPALPISEELVQAISAFIQTL